MLGGAAKSIGSRKDMKERMKAFWSVFAMAAAATVLMTGCEGGGDGGSIAVGARVPQGSKLDYGLEVPDAAPVARVWGDTAPRMGIMLQANSPNTGGDRSLAYYCPEIAAETGSFKISANSDGTLTATGKDFVSPRSGLVYKFMGFSLREEANGIREENPIIIQPNDQRGTFRGYWNTYEAAK